MPIFIDNKYTRWYYAIITNAQSRLLLGYIETAREHFICHWLLTKMVKGKAYKSMIFAFKMMFVNTSKQKRYKPPSYVYEKLKIKCSKQRKGFKHSPETIKKIKQNLRDENGIAKNKGITTWNKGLTKEDPVVAAMYQNRKPNNTWRKNFRKTHEKEQRRLQTICKPVSIDGIVYISAKEAYRKLGNIKYTTLIKRIESNTFPNYKWV